jgi:hypothetical protein
MNEGQKANPPRPCGAGGDLFRFAPKLLDETRKVTIIWRNPRQLRGVFEGRDKERG